MNTDATKNVETQEKQDEKSTVIGLHPRIKAKLLTTLRRGDIEIIVCKHPQRSSLWVVKNAVSWQNLFYLSHCYKTNTYKIKIDKQVVAHVDCKENNEQVKSTFWDIVSLIHAIEDRKEELTFLRTGAIPDMTPAEKEAFYYLGSNTR